MTEKLIATIEVVPVRRLTWKNFIKELLTFGIGPFLSDVKHFGTVVLEVTEKEQAFIYRIKSHERELLATFPLTKEQLVLALNRQYNIQDATYRYTVLPKTFKDLSI